MTPVLSQERNFRLSTSSVVSHIEHVLEQTSPELAAALERSGARMIGAPPTRTEVAQRLARRGIQVADAYLDFFERMEGLEVRGLRIGLAATDDTTGLSGVDGAVPIATAPSDAVMWMDVDGTVYDDTDLERAVPVGRGATGLLEYWLLVLDGRRWSGAVHDWYLRLAYVEREALLDVLPAPVGAFAIGEGVSLWPERACELTDRLDCAQAEPKTSAVVSASDMTRWVDALIRIHRAHPDIILVFDSPAVQIAHGPIPNEVRRIRCRGRFSGTRSGWLVLSDASGGNYTPFLVTAATRS